jgi:hypothetical protein
VHGDFSNVTFVPGKQYSQVFDLQGRVGLDSLQNEQRAIAQYYLRTALADLLGPAAGPSTINGAQNTGFRIELSGSDLTIGAGRYYVDGIAVSNDDPGAGYLRQPPFDRVKEHPLAPAPLPAQPFLIYLKVWERHVTETEDPALHESALGMHHPDAASRAQVTWRVAVEPAMPDDKPEARTKAAIATWVQDWLAQARSSAGHGRLRVRAARPEDADENPCTAGPEAAYIGENQFYRVEIRSGGAAEDATFVWSRDNGSVIFPIETCTDTKVQVSTLGRDWHTTLRPGDWVEAVDDTVSLRAGLGRPETAPPLRQVVDVFPESSVVILDLAPPDGVGTDPLLHPYLRRWDMPEPDPNAPAAPGAATAAGVPVLETDLPIPVDLEDGLWIPLERGIEVQFLPSTGTEPQQYRCGDYWVFPARRVLADVVFDHPTGADPQGVAYHYAPLAVVESDGSLTRNRQLFAPGLTAEP